MHAPAERALEVVSIFDRTVVSVQHLRRDGPARVGPRPLLVAGALSLAVAAGCFAWALLVARADASERARHLATGAPEHAFRPARLPAAAELGAGLGLAAGVALCGAGLARRRDGRAAPGGDPAGELVTCDETGAWLQLLAGMEIEIAAPGASGTTRAIASAERIALPEGARARIDHGLCRTLVAPVPAPAALATAARPDGRSLAYAAGSALAHGLVLALIWSIAPDGRVLAADGGLGAERMILVRDPAFERARLRPTPDGASATGASSAAVSLGGIQGRGGQGDSGAPGRGHEPGAASSAAARARARHAGVLGLFAASPQRFAAVTGSADFGAGIEVADWRGGPGGRGGLDGPGLGWGHDLAPTGAGPLRTIAAGGFEVGHWTGPAGSPRLRDRDAKRPPAPVLGTPRVEGGLDAAIIRRHIRRQLPRIRHCYERRLFVRPELAGTVTVSLAIGSDGSALGVRAAGTGDRPLESCVAAAVATIAFPATEGGGIVNVTYPFTFRSTAR